METDCAFYGMQGLFCFSFLSVFHDVEGAKILKMVLIDDPRSPVALLSFLCLHLTFISFDGLERESASFSSSDSVKLLFVKEEH